MPKLNTEWIVQPHGALAQIDEGLWAVEGSIVMPIGRFPRRMTIVALEHGGFAVWSPIALDAVQMARIDAIGPVRFLIVPNQAHRLDLAPWKARYPQAKVIAPPSARGAVAQAAPVDATDDIIGDPSISSELVDGTKADEFALIVRRPDGATLILNDILSRVSNPHGIGANIMARLMGFGVRRPQTSRPVRRMFIADPTAVARQFRRWAALPDLRRIIVSHVDLIEHEPAAALRRAADDLAPER